MTHQAMKEMYNFGRTGAPVAVGSFGRGAKTGPMACAKDAIVFTIARTVDGPSTCSVGLLSRSLQAMIKDQLQASDGSDLKLVGLSFELLPSVSPALLLPIQCFARGHAQLIWYTLPQVVPIVTWSRETMQLHVDEQPGEELQKASCYLDLIKAATPFHNEFLLERQFSRIGAHGTLVCLFNLHEGENMLDLETVADDVRVTKRQSGEQQQAEKSQQGEGRLFMDNEALPSPAFLPGVRVCICARDTLTGHVIFCSCCNRSQELPTRAAWAARARLRCAHGLLAKSILQSAVPAA